MYSLAHKSDNCVVDPDYNEAYCGFNDKVGCLPINGCGSSVSYPFWISFTTLVTFVVLNVFVAVILEAFDDSANAEDAKLTDEQWSKFCSIWCKFVGLSHNIESVSDAFKMDMNYLLPFFKALDEPMGFRREDGTIIASDKALTAEIQNMDITTVQFKNDPGLWAEFSNVAVASAKRVMVAALNVDDVGALYDDFADAENIERKQSGKNIDSKHSKDATVQLNAKQYFAALRIACAFRSHKFREKIQERVRVHKDMGASS